MRRRGPVRLAALFPGAGERRGAELRRRNVLLRQPHLRLLMNLPGGMDEAVRRDGIGYNNAPTARTVKKKIVNEIKGMLSGAFPEAESARPSCSILDGDALAAIVERAVAGASARRGRTPGPPGDGGDHRRGRGPGGAGHARGQRHRLRRPRHSGARARAGRRRRCSAGRTCPSRTGRCASGARRRRVGHSDRLRRRVMAGNVYSVCDPDQYRKAGTPPT